METSSPSWNMEPTLAGGGMTIRPFTLDQTASLQAVLDPDCFRYYPWAPASFGEEDLARYCQARRDSGCFLCLAFCESTGEPLALSSFMDPRPKDRGLEIGHTIIRKAHRGTWVNPVMKLLMIGHAFESMGVRRVQIKCDANNARSWKAIEKVGAQHEGVLRSVTLLHDGAWRSVAYFSILDDEWPKVRQILRALASERGAQNVI